MVKEWAFPAILDDSGIASLIGRVYLLSHVGRHGRKAKRMKHQISSGGLCQSSDAARCAKAIN